jgi:hypothetical protein
MRRESEPSPPRRGGSSRRGLRTRSRGPRGSRCGDAARRRATCRGTRTRGSRAGSRAPSVGGRCVATSSGGSTSASVPAPPEYGPLGSAAASTSAIEVSGLRRRTGRSRPPRNRLSPRGGRGLRAPGAERIPQRRRPSRPSRAGLPSTGRWPNPSSLGLRASSRLAPREATGLGASGAPALEAGVALGAARQELGPTSAPAVQVACDVPVVASRPSYSEATRIAIVSQA